MSTEMQIVVGATLSLIGLLVIYFIKRGSKETPPKKEPIDRLTPVHIDIRGSNPWIGDEIIANFLRFCRKTEPTAIVLGFVSPAGLTQPGLLTTGEYTSHDDIPEEILDQIERAAWAREFDRNRAGDQRLFNSWLGRMVRRLKAEADAHFQSKVPGPMEIPDWFKSVLDFAVKTQGTGTTISQMTQQMNNAAGEASDGHAKGTATFGALTVQIRVYIDGLGKKAARRQSSFALQKQ